MCYTLVQGAGSLDRTGGGDILVNKNDRCRMIIEDISSEGLGIGHTEGEAIFVKDTLPGDEAEVLIIKAKKNMAYGKLLDLIRPSDCRVSPLCDNARSCGGCTLQHMDYTQQRIYKWNKVKSLMERIGGMRSPELIMEGEKLPDGRIMAYGMEDPYHFRNKMQFPVGRGKDGKVKVGFYAGRTHSIIDLEDCPIGHEVNSALIKALKVYIEKCNVSTYDELSGEGLIRHMLTRVGFSTGELMVCIVINGDSIPASDVLISGLKAAAGQYEGIALKSVSVNINKEKTNRILGRKTKTVFGSGHITDYIGDVRFSISPASFYQVNPAMTGRLYEKALEYAGLTGNETVWDLYCGIGTISLFLAKKALKVYGVEIVPDAVRDAKENALLNGIDNAEFYEGKAEDVVTRIYSENLPGANADVVVVDPPRKGCDIRLLDTISEMAPKRLVYVSCDPATLARDIKYLTGNGFEVSRIAVYDQFPNSVHCESIALLDRVHR